MWKSKLNEKWMNGRYSCEDDSAGLQQIRNSFGPSWLVKFKLGLRADTVMEGTDFHKALAAQVESGPLGENPLGVKACQLGQGHHYVTNEADSAGLTIDDIIELLQEFKAQAGNLRTTVSAIGTPGGNGALRFITLRPDTNISTAKNAAIYGEGR